MKNKDTEMVCGKLQNYRRPEVEVAEVKIEQGFAASTGNNESWNETPGGGDF